MIANRYARALADVILARGEINVVSDELRDFAAMIGGHSELRELLANPVIPMERKRESQQLCKSRKCKSQFAALKARTLLGRYHPSSHALDASRNPTKPGTFSCLKTDPPWRQVAGPAVAQFCI